VSGFLPAITPAPTRGPCAAAPCSTSPRPSAARSNSPACTPASPKAELARRIGVCQASVYRWETGSKVPSGAHLLCLIAVLPEFGRLLAQAARHHAQTRSSRPRTV